MPTNIVTAITAMVISVAAAFFDSGGLKAGTPSEIASTPVMAVQPLANAVSKANAVSIPALNVGSGSTGGGAVGSPEETRQRPDAISMSMIAMKPYVGAANMRADSRMPRKLPSISSITNP